MKKKTKQKNKAKKQNKTKQKLNYLIDPSFQKVNRPFENQSFKFITKDGFKIVNQIDIKKTTVSSL